MLTGGDSLSIKEYFIECPYEKNIHIASLADNDDCAGYRKMRVDLAVRFINLVKKNYPIVLIDCDESTDDPLSMYSLTLSDHIIYVIRPSLQSVVFAKAHESIVTGLQIKELMKLAYIGAARGESELYAPFGINGGHVFLPYCKDLANPEGARTPIVLSHGVNRAAARYRREIFALADSYIAVSAAGGQTEENM